MNIQRSQVDGRPDPRSIRSILPDGPTPASCRDGKRYAHKRRDALLRDRFILLFDRFCLGAQRRAAPLKHTD